jgi:predicted ester cyclase
MSEQNKAVVRRIVEDHWNKKNPALASELFVAAASIHTPDGTFNGVEGAKQLLAAYATAFPDFHNKIDDLFSEGDKVTLRWTFTGTHKGLLAGIAATGKKVNVGGNIGIFQIANGKAGEVRMAWDKYELMQQIGALANQAGQ